MAIDKNHELEGQKRFSVVVAEAKKKHGSHAGRKVDTQVLYAAVINLLDYWAALPDEDLREGMNAARGNLDNLISELAD